MNKLFLIAVLLFFCFPLYGQTGSKKEIPANQWVSFYKEGGVEFFVKNQESPFDAKFNTLIRLKNNNNFEVTVSFMPSYLCPDNNMADQSEVRVNLYPRHTVTLLATRPCSGSVPLDLVIKQKKIKAR